MTPKPAPRPLSMLAQRAHRKAVRRRWIKRTIVGGALLLTIGVVGLYLGRGTLTRSLALSRLESALGYEASCSSAEILPNGRVSLPGLALLAKGVEGEAGEIVRAERVELAVDWWRSVFDPASAVTSVRLIEPVFRVSVDVETGELNLGTAGGGGAATPAALPPVSVERARLVFGEHGPSWFAPLHEIAISGSMRRDAGSDGVYAVRLAEDARPGRAPAVLEGEIDLRRGSGSLALRDVDFAALRSENARPYIETLLRKLRVGGRLPLATLEYAPDGSFRVAADLTSVDVQAPVPILNPQAAGVPDQLMNLSGVTGQIVIDQDGFHANFAGFFEDLDARVIIETQGLSVASDASVEVVVSDYRLGPTPALLPFAPALAAEFVQRFSGPEATINGRVRLSQTDGEPTASGLFTWRDGSAAFEDFPYPLREVAGRMTFDNSGVYVTDLRGVGPTGSDIRAEITAVPPGDDAEIEARIVAERAPVDRHLIDAIGGERGEAIAALFIGEGSHGIEPGGEIDLEIDVYKRGGEFGPWGWDVRATSPELGIAGGERGYPLLARGFALTLDRDHATAEVDELVGPTGLRGRATLELPLRDASGLASTGTLEIHDAPIDDLLLDAARSASPEIGDALGERDLTGALSAEIAFEIDPSGDPALEGHISFRDLTLHDAGGVRPLRGLDGNIEIGGDGVTIDAAGVGPGGADLALAGRRGSGEGWYAMSAFTGGSFGDAARRELASLHPSVGRAFSRAIDEWGLDGAVGGIVELDDAPGEEIRWSVLLTDFEDATMRLGGERVAFENTRGGIELSNNGARFDGVFASAYGDAGPIGEWMLDGETPREDEETLLGVTGQGVRLASPFVREIATRWADNAVRDAIATADPAGVAEVGVEIRQGEDGARSVRGALYPERLEITRDGVRTTFSEATGRAVFDAEGLRFENLRLHAEGWDLLLDGAYDESSGFAGEVDLTANAVTPDLLASLPAEAAAAAGAIGLEIAEGGGLWVTGDVGGAAPLVIGFTHASFSLGVPVDRASGRLTLGEDDAGRRVGELELESFRAATVPMRAGRALLVWEDDAGTVSAPALTAECAGGVIRGSARLARAEGLGDEREFLVDVRCADVPLAWIIERPEGEPRPEDSLPARGLIGGQLRVRGMIGGDGSRRVGRGFFTISGGEVLRLPLLTPVFELLNFQPPTGERLTDAAIEFGLAGDRLLFDRLFVQSDSIVVSASGEARLDDGTLDLAVRTRGRARVPMLSDLIDAFKDELLGARISGAIASPKYELVQLPNAGRVLLGVLAPGAGGRVDKAAPPERPALADHVPSTLEPIDE